MLVQKITVSLFLLFFISFSSFSQKKELEEIDDFSSELLSLFSNFGDNIDTFFKKEKKKKIYRYLGYFQNDLRRYANIKKKLIDDLVANDFVVSNNNKTKSIVRDLKSRLSKLKDRLFKISSLTSTELSNNAAIIIAKINNEEQQSLYLTNLEKLMNGKTVYKEKLLEDGQMIYTQLNSSISLLSKIRDELK